MDLVPDPGPGLVTDPNPNPAVALVAGSKRLPRLVFSLQLARGSLINPILVLVHGHGLGLATTAEARLAAAIEAPATAAIAIAIRTIATRVLRESGIRIHVARAYQTMLAMVWPSWISAVVIGGVAVVVTVRDVMMIMTITLMAVGTDYVYYC